MQEQISPKSTALIIIDMQNAMCHPKGLFARHGYDVRELREIIQPIQKVLQFSREKSLPIIFTRLVYKKDLSDAGRFAKIRPFLKEEGGLCDGTWEAEVIEELKPLHNEFDITKNRYSAFFNTRLADVLQSLGVETLIFTGQGTNGCVDSTIRDAYYRDYRVILLEDCTAAWDARLKEATFETVKYAFGEVVPSKELFSSM